MSASVLPLRVIKSDELPEPDEQGIREMAKDKKWVKKLRGRLCSISWFMGILAENIARRANMEASRLKGTTASRQVFK